jgi:hypothetical protein
MSCVACLTIFPHHLINGTIFEKKKSIEHKIFGLIFFYNVYLKQISFYEKFSAILSHMYMGLHAKYPIPCQILVKTEFSHNKFSKKAQISNFMKNRLLGAELFRADGQTYGMTAKHDDDNNRSS